MTVVDASILIAAFVENTEDAAWSRAEIARRDLSGPEFVLSEVSNVLRRMELINRITSDDAKSALDDILGFGLDLYPFTPYADRVWELRHNLTCYDAWYVALAEDLGCPLVTLDRRIARSGAIECEVITPPTGYVS